MSNYKDDNEEDDYMSAAFLDPTSTNTKTATPDSSLSRTKRRKAAAMSRSRQPSKAELAAQHRQQTAEALSKSIADSNSNNKGLSMMRKLGFKPGDTLGTPGAEGLKVPISVEMREGREGIGKESEGKKRMREEMGRREGAEKRAKVTEGEYVERMRREREEGRLEGLVKGAMRAAEGLDEKAVGYEGEGLEGAMGKGKPDVVWRGLRRERERKRGEEWDRKRGFERETRLPGYEGEDDDEEEDGDGLGAKARKLARMVEEDGEDEELDEFERLPVAERLEKVVEYLRDRHWYCFWCKTQYEEEGLPGCPGLTEEEHD